MADDHQHTPNPEREPAASSGSQVPPAPVEDPQRDPAGALDEAEARILGPPETRPSLDHPDHEHHDEDDDGGIDDRETSDGQQGPIPGEPP
jgi:hypothetical protein